jgi:hypothetical protein
MPLNDDVDDEFDGHLEDEYVFDSNPPPGIEMLGVRVEPDRGSGSYAEDGRLEVLEDRVMENGEIGGSGYTASDGQSEIGEHGSGYIAADGPSEIGEQGNGYIAAEGPSEIGFGGDDDLSDDDLLGDANVLDYQYEIGAGHYPIDGASELGAGHYPIDGASELGSAAMYGQTEIGYGHYPTEGLSELGSGHYPTEGASEIGRAILKVVEKARDNRQPAPPMRAVDVDSEGWDDGWLSDEIIGAAVASETPDAFPLTAKLLQAAGAGGEPRIVRVDTEASYKAFRAANSPEMAEMAERVADLQHKLDQHIADPSAHEDVEDDIADLTVLGAEVEAGEDAKRVQLFMPRRFDGFVTAWREGDFVCASLSLPGQDGEVRICTSIEPIRKCVAEMSHHAADAGVSASAVVGALEEMGCVLGAGTILKEVAASAPAILQRPEAVHKAPFEVRIEPKTSPAMTALLLLAHMCRQGDGQACEEWKRLGEASAPAVRQAMFEAVEIARAAA